jgi:NADPH2:quinone reductase
MTLAIVVSEHGKPEVLKPQGIAVNGELLLRQTAIGVNFHDCYVRSGLYRTLSLPGIPGIEAVGVIARVGPAVDHVRPGQRVGYVTSEYGAYAETRVLSADRAIVLPDHLDDVSAASILLKGLTACMLVRKVHAVQKGETVLVHAAAGGVGQLLCAWPKHLGAEVIATVGSEEKAEIARRAGADHVIFYREREFAAEVSAITRSEGVAAAYDAIGRDTFKGSLASLGYFGELVNYGQASGPIEPFSPSVLAAKSNAITRPIVFHYLRRRKDLEAMARETFAAVASGVLKPNTFLRLPLANVAEAHRVLEGRGTTGSIVLAPDTQGGSDEVQSVRQNTSA